MTESLHEKIERLIGDFDEPFNFRNVLYGTLERVYLAQGSPSTLPDLEPAGAYDAVRDFVESMVEKLGLGLVVRIVIVHDAHYWRELFKITVFLDEVTDTYVLQFFEHQSILTIARISRESVDWGFQFAEGSPQETAFNGFVLGICRNVPVRPKQEGLSIPVELDESGTVLDVSDITFDDPEGDMEIDF